MHYLMLNKQLWKRVILTGIMGFLLLPSILLVSLVLSLFIASILSLPNENMVVAMLFLSEGVIEASKEVLIIMFTHSLPTLLMCGLLGALGCYVLQLLKLLAERYWQTEEHV